MPAMQLQGAPRIAIIHDWLLMLGGADKVLLHIVDCFPDADLYCLVEALPDDIRGEFPRNIKSTFIQGLPRVRKWYWYYAPLMPLAVEQIDLSGYDLVLSCCHAFAKGVICHPYQLHIAYSHSPMRFAYDLQSDYYRNFRFQRGLKRYLSSLIFHYLRIWDSRSVNSVDRLLANSNFVRRRIKKCYRRDAEVIYPGIETDRFCFQAEKKDYYLAGSFMNPFKRLDLVIAAFNRMPDKKLLLFGSGPQERKLKKMAGPNIVFLGKVADEKLVTLLQNARAFVFAATEDFGMIMAEAQACGTPVIAYKDGGAVEIIQDLKNSDKPTGLFFDELSPECLRDALADFEKNSHRIQPLHCRENALRFDVHVFKSRYARLVEDSWNAWQAALLSELP